MARRVRATKTCEHCFCTFARHNKFSAAQWSAARFCSLTCSSAVNATHKSDQDHFFSFVSPEPNSGCWLWTGPIRGHMGYGTFKIKGGRSVSAHRFSYVMDSGDISSDVCVCHDCDNPLCVNPTHLFIGTHADNKRDCMNKGRAIFGERSGRARLTEQDVITIRDERRSGAHLAYLAEKFNVSAGAISAAVNGWSWRHIR